MLAVLSPAAALELLALAQRRLGGMVSTFELIHRMGFDFLAETMPDLRAPFDPVPEWLVLIELGLPAALEPEPTMAALYAEGADAGLVTDGVIATSEAQAASLWHLREMIPQANRQIGAVSSHDISLPLSEIPGFIAKAPAALRPLGEFRVNCFGHLGDGNLHWNVFPAKGASRRDHDAGARPGEGGGASHGACAGWVGRGRAWRGAAEGRGPAALWSIRESSAAMRDQGAYPFGIMNPGAVLAER